ncbi:hypothetical protein GGR74_003853 [Xanthomonas arboricola]
MRPRQPLSCAHAAGLAKPRLVACTTAQWPSMLMQALSMDESRLLPKGRAVYQRTTAFGAFAPNAKVGLIFIAVAIATGYLRGFFALFPGARARTAGPPTGRMWCPIALAMLTNGLHADEAGSEKRWEKAADVGCAASSAMELRSWTCVHAPAPACRCLSGRRCRRAAISNMQRCAAFRNTAMCTACDAAAGAGDTGRMKCDGQAAIAALRKERPALHAQAQPRSG